MVWFTTCAFPRSSTWTLGNWATSASARTFSASALHFSASSCRRKSRQSAKTLGFSFAYLFYQEYDIYLVGTTRFLSTYSQIYQSKSSSVASNLFLSFPGFKKMGGHHVVSRSAFFSYKNSSCLISPENNTNPPLDPGLSALILFLPFGNGLLARLVSTAEGEVRI